MTRHNHTKLPEDVLLEIFDAYRQLYQLQPNYEQAWNGKDGWFKLAHVCLHWRRVLFLSSSRLHVHLLLTPHRPWNPVLRCLPHFPIFFDYTTVSAPPLRWTDKEENLALAAISHRSRVRRIALQEPCSTRVLQALSHPFPELESLKLEFSTIYAFNPRRLVIPATLLSGSAPCLRQLTLRIVELEALLPLLSSATGLEELALTISVHSTIPEASFVANLQRMSCLRRLELKLPHSHRVTTLSPNPPPPATAGDVVTLPRLTDFIFKGHGLYLQMLVVKLAAPSLQHLDIERWTRNTFDIFPTPQLSNFICHMECQFKVVHLDFLYWKVNFCAETCHKSDRAQPFRLNITRPFPWEQIVQILSEPLSTVEELIVGQEIPEFPQAGHQEDLIQWRGFFSCIRQVKIVRVHHLLALHVVLSLQLDDQEPDLDLLPALEQVEVYAPIRSNGKEEYVFIRDAFGPLIAARQQVGRPIRFSWIDSRY